MLPSNPVPDPGNPQVTHDFKRLDGSLQVETKAGEEVQRAVIDYAFGSRDHFMTFVGRDDQGRSRMLRISHYQSPRGSGWDLSTGLPQRPENPHEYLGTTMLEGDGVRRCLFCHTTNFRAVLDQAGPEAKDLAIGCEKCHGPGGHHVAAVEAGFPDLAILNPGRLPGPAVNKTCGQCHDLHDTSVISAPRTDPVWYRFQSLALTWSRCYTESEGNLSCVTCHDPHNYGKTSAARQEAKCLSCHGPDPAPASTADTPLSAPPSQTNPLQQKTSSKKPRTTCPVDPAKGCIECHMPSAWQRVHPFLQDRSLHPRPRSARSGEMMGYDVGLGRSARRPRSMASEKNRADRHADGHEKVGQQTRLHRARDDRVIPVRRKEHGVDHLEGDGAANAAGQTADQRPGNAARPCHPQPSASPAVMPTTAQMPPRTRNDTSRDGVSSL